MVRMAAESWVSTNGPPTRVWSKFSSQVETPFALRLSCGIAEDGPVQRPSSLEAKGGEKEGAMIAYTREEVNVLKKSTTLQNYHTSPKESESTAPPSQTSPIRPKEMFSPPGLRVTETDRTNVEHPPKNSEEHQKVRKSPRNVEKLSGSVKGSPKNRENFSGNVEESSKNVEKTPQNIEKSIKNVGRSRKNVVKCSTNVEKSQQNIGKSVKNVGKLCKNVERCSKSVQKCSQNPVNSMQNIRNSSKSIEKPLIIVQPPRNVDKRESPGSEQTLEWDVGRLSGRRLESCKKLEIIGNGVVSSVEKRKDTYSWRRYLNGQGYSWSRSKVLLGREQPSSSGEEYAERHSSVMVSTKNTFISLRKRGKGLERRSLSDDDHRVFSGREFVGLSAEKPRRCSFSSLAFSEQGEQVPLIGGGVNSGDCVKNKGEKYFCYENDSELQEAGYASSDFDYGYVSHKYDQYFKTLNYLHFQTKQSGKYQNKSTEEPQKKIKGFYFTDGKLLSKGYNSDMGQSIDCIGSSTDTGIVSMDSGKTCSEYSFLQKERTVVSGADSTISGINFFSTKTPAVPTQAKNSQNQIAPQNCLPTKLPSSLEWPPNEAAQTFDIRSDDSQNGAGNTGSSNFAMESPEGTDSFSGEIILSVQKNIKGKKYRRNFEKSDLKSAGKERVKRSKKKKALSLSRENEEENFFSHLRKMGKKCKTSPKEMLLYVAMLNRSYMRSISSVLSWAFRERGEVFDSKMRRIGKELRAKLHKKTVSKFQHSDISPMNTHRSKNHWPTEELYCPRIKSHRRKYPEENSEKYRRKKKIALTDCIKQLAAYTYTQIQQRSQTENSKSLRVPHHIPPSSEEHSVKNPDPNTDPQPTDRQLITDGAQKSPQIIPTLQKFPEKVAHKFTGKYGEKYADKYYTEKYWKEEDSESKKCCGLLKKEEKSGEKSESKCILNSGGLYGKNADEEYSRKDNSYKSDKKLEKSYNVLYYNGTNTVTRTLAPPRVPAFYETLTKGRSHMANNGPAYGVTMEKCGLRMSDYTQGSNTRCEEKHKEKRENSVFGGGDSSGVFNLLAPQIPHEHMTKNTIILSTSSRPSTHWCQPLFVPR